MYLRYVEQREIYFHVGYALPRLDASYVSKLTSSRPPLIPLMLRKCFLPSRRSVLIWNRRSSDGLVAEEGPRSSGSCFWFLPLAHSVVLGRRRRQIELRILNKIDATSCFLSAPVLRRSVRTERGSRAIHLLPATLHADCGNTGPAFCPRILRDFVGLKIQGFLRTQHSEAAFQFSRNRLRGSKGFGCTSIVGTFRDYPASVRHLACQGHRS